MISHPKAIISNKGSLGSGFLKILSKVHKDSYKLLLRIIFNLGYYVYGMVNIHKRVVSFGRGNVLNQSFGMKFNSKIRQAIAFNSDLHIISVLFCVIYINIFDYLDSLLSRLHVFNPVPASVDN